MLAQLICVDRRYQRMNCFNIRELQGILKRKFFTDLVNSNDHRELLNNSMIGLRFKTNNNNTIDPDMSIFYNLGTTFNSKIKKTNLTNMYLTDANNNELFNINIFSISSYFSYVINFFKNIFFYPLNSFSNLQLNNSYLYLMDFLYNIIYSLQNVSVISITSLTSIITQIKNIILLNFNFNLVPNLYNVRSLNDTNLENNQIEYSSDNILYNTSTTNSLTSELSNSFRMVRFNNPLISYDYKCGNYLGI
jgi:hypothetical protein